MVPYLCLFIIIISILFFPLHSSGQIYKWVDEKGTVHFTDDPSKIPDHSILKTEKSNQNPTSNPLIDIEKLKDDLKKPVDQKSNGTNEGRWVFKVYEDKSMRDLVYLIGLLIIILILIKILRELRPVPIKGNMRPEISLTPRKRPIIFNVYYRDYITDSMVFLGKIIERRKIERGNNLKDLLYKARQDYSPRVKDPSAIFLLSS